MNRETDWKFNLLAGAATVHDGLFLLLRRSSRESFLPGAWGIPAGQVQRGEDPSVTCRRELLEETGLHGRIIDTIGYSHFTSLRQGVELNNLQVNFLVAVPELDVTLDPASHSEYHWISLDEPDSDFLDEFTRNILESARHRYKETSDSKLSRR